MFLFGLVLLSGDPMPLYPYCGYIPVFFALNFVVSFANGGLNSGKKCFMYSTV